jgi:RNA polymerase sigma-70 factor (ECF subfamily)
MDEHEMSNNELWRQSVGFSFSERNNDVTQEVSDGSSTPEQVPLDSVRNKENRDPRDAERQAELVTRFLTGDEQAFRLITDLYGGLLLRTAYLLVKDEESAKDIVQDSLVLAWKNMHTLREHSFLRAWLLKIVVNQSMSFKRQIARKATFLREQFVQYVVDTSIQETASQRGHLEDTLDLKRAIDQLPLNQRAVIVLFYYHHMTMPEIEETLGVAENTLRKRLQSALEKIRRVLKVDPASSNASATNYIHPRMNVRGGEQR